MSDQDEDVIPSGLALQQVSSWLGVDAAAVLEQDTDPAVEEMFSKPRPMLLGLGAKYLSHKEASGLELKLQRSLRRSGADAAQGTRGHQAQQEPARLDRPHHKRRRQEQEGLGGLHGAQQQQQQQPAMRHGKGGLHQQESGDSSDSDEEEGGKLGHMHQLKKGLVSEQQKKVINREQLLQVPAENLSKWQRKRLRDKAKKQQQQQQQQEIQQGS